MVVTRKLVTNIKFHTHTGVFKSGFLHNKNVYKSLGQSAKRVIKFNLHKNNQHNNLNYN